MYVFKRRLYYRRKWRRNRWKTGSWKRVAKGNPPPLTREILPIEKQLLEVVKTACDFYNMYMYILYIFMN